MGYEFERCVSVASVCWPTECGVVLLGKICAPQLTLRRQAEIRPLLEGVQH